MALKILAWERWQGAAVKKVLGQRERRAAEAGREPSSATYPMTFIALSTHFDRHFCAYVDLLGRIQRKVGDAYFVRTLQYAGLHCATTGVILVTRNSFGPVVLSVPHHRVSAHIGGSVWDALCASGICEDTDAACDPTGGPRAVRRAAHCATERRGEERTPDPERARPREAAGPASAGGGTTASPAAGGPHYTDCGSLERIGAACDCRSREGIA